MKSYPWVFKSSKLYPQIMKIKETKIIFIIRKNKNKLILNSHVNHGPVDTRGYLFKKIAYISDCKSIPNKTLKMLKNLDVLIIDCLGKLVMPHI